MLCFRGQVPSGLPLQRSRQMLPRAERKAESSASAWSGASLSGMGVAFLGLSRVRFAAHLQPHLQGLCII